MCVFSLCMKEEKHPLGGSIQACCRVRGTSLTHMVGGKRCSSCYQVFMKKNSATAKASQNVRRWDRKGVNKLKILY